MTVPVQPHSRHTTATLWHDLQAVMALVSQVGVAQCKPSLSTPTPPI